MVGEILIVLADDEPVILEMLQIALEDGGYAVAPVSNSQEALKILTSEASRRRALVTDVDMGRDSLDGWALAQNARELDPDIPVVYMTGANGDEWSARGVPKSILLAKPFAPAQLITAVSQLLNDL